MKFSQYLTENAQAFDNKTVAITLSNDEHSTDKEIIEFLVGETGFDKAELSKLVKAERDTFMGSKYAKDAVAMKVIKTYLKKHKG